MAAVGTTGSGKTALAVQLGQILSIPHVELDELHWDTNWTPAPLAVFRERVSQALGGSAWVVDGNYSKVRDIVWRRADHLIWLDYSLAVVLGRLLRRTLARVLTREELWNGNRERLSTLFLSRDSLLLWALRSYRKRRIEYPALVQQPEYAHLKVVHLRSPRSARAWLECLLNER